jgi:hypothetical protein
MDDVSSLVGELDSVLRAEGDAVKAAGARAYLKIDLEFLDRHIGEVSGVTFREGSKYLPEAQRELLHRACGRH